MRGRKPIETVRRYLPTLGQTHMLVREFTLIFTVLFTVVSLAAFWMHMAVVSDIPEQTIQASVWMLNIIAVGILAWPLLWFARMYRGTRLGDRYVQ